MFELKLHVQKFHWKTVTLSRKLLLAKPTLVLLVLTKSDVAYVIINKHIGKMGKHVDAILAAKGGHTDF